MHPRALDSQECFLPPRGDFNLRCTRERYKRWSRFFEQNFRVDKWNLCPPGATGFSPGATGFSPGATGFPGLRWRGERYIPKNVFFLREEILIYDAPESATSGGPDSLNRISASISGTSAGIRLPRGPRASDEADGNTGRSQPGFFRITGKKYFVLYLRWLGEGKFLVQILCGGSVIGRETQHDGG